MRKTVKIKNKGFIHQNFMKKISGGFMIVEIIVAVAIIVLSVLAAMTVTQKSISVSRQALHVSQATFLLEEGAEVVRVLRDNAWSNISSLSVGTNYYPTFSSSWTLSTSPSTVDIFTRTVTIANVNRDATSGDIITSGVDDPGTKLITVTISWAESGQAMSKTLSFYIMDIFS